MSNNDDGGSRVDQYFVTSYTEVCIIIPYRSNLNHLRSISAYNREIQNRNDEKRPLKKTVRSACEISDLLWFIRWAPKKGSLSIFIFTACPSRHARRLSASLATTVSRTYTSAMKLM